MTSILDQQLSSHVWTLVWESGCYCPTCEKRFGLGPKDPLNWLLSFTTPREKSTCTLCGTWGKVKTGNVPKKMKKDEIIGFIGPCCLPKDQKKNPNMEHSNECDKCGAPSEIGTLRLFNGDQYRGWEDDNPPYPWNTIPTIKRPC